MKTDATKNTEECQIHMRHRTRSTSLVNATLIAAVGACMWLSGGQVCKAADAPVPRFPVKETRKEGAKKGDWDVTTEVKNDTAAAEDIVWYSWPAAEGGKKIGSLTWYPAGTVSADPVATDTPEQAESRSKHPKQSDPTTTPPTNPGQNVAAGATVTGTATMSTEPHTTYVRVYKKNPDGTWGDPTGRADNIVAHNIFLAAFRVPNTDPPSEYVSFPVRIPYPTDLADLTDYQPANFFIKSVTLANGWSSAFLAPSIEQRFTLLPHQREFSGILVAQMTNELAEGQHAILGVTWGAESGTVTNYETTIRYLVMKDNTPPTVQLQAQRRPEGTLVTIGVQDPGGIHHRPHLTASRIVGQSTTTEVCVVPFARVFQEDPQQEIGATAAVFEVTVRSPVAGEMLNLQASAIDQFGNASSSPVQVFIGVGIQGIKLSGRRVEIMFTGTLLEADEVTGPYIPVAGATSTYSVIPAGDKKFFKAE